jgi:TRAP-type C4-dicarboxylate transport system permease large subunit
VGADAPAIIIFGLKFGIFTPTEAAVVCAVYALFVAMFIYRELKWHQLYTVFVTSAKTTAIVMFLVAAALVSSWLITVAHCPDRSSRCSSRSWAVSCCS